MQNQLEFKSLGLKIDNFDEIKGIFTGYASAFNKVDKVKDTIAFGAYDLMMKRWQDGQAIRINFEHDKSLLLADNISAMSVDDYGLLVTFQFSEAAKKLYPDIWQWAVSKAKARTLSMSIGYTVLKSDLGTQRHALKKKFGEPDTIYSLLLDHIAITDIPVDVNAKILEVKSFVTPKYPIQLSENWDGDAAEKRWREFSNSVEKPSSTYKNGFLYFEDGREDLFGAYHFNLVDVVDGEAVINERAVITAHAYLKGARRGVKILDAQQKIKALEIISQLYEKINRLRKEQGIDPLPAVEIKAEINYKSLIDETVDGQVSAKRFLKNHQGSLSNTNIEYFIDKVMNLTKSEVKNKIELETKEKSQGTESTSVIDGQKTAESFLDGIGSLFNQ
jgi:HK97 family phage prohead protease